ncbi:MAG: bacterioferritin [Dehalococcoidia bacterium]
MPKGSPEFINALNEALAEEMASSIQYLWHHIMARGMESVAVVDKFRELSMVEMRHGYAIAERIDLLGGVPSTAIGPIKVGGDVRKMLQDDLDAEYEAIAMYRRLVKQAEREDDPGSRRLLEEILRETEEHARDLESMLGR